MKERKKDRVSWAADILKDHEILTARPEGMDFYVYKFLRDSQRFVLKKMFRRCPDRKFTGIIPGNIIYKTKRR